MGSETEEKINGRLLGAVSLPRCMSLGRRSPDGGEGGVGSHLWNPPQCEIKSNKIVTVLVNYSENKRRGSITCKGVLAARTNSMPPGSVSTTNHCDFCGLKRPLGSDEGPTAPTVLPCLSTCFFESTLICTLITLAS